MLTREKMYRKYFLQKGRNEFLEKITGLIDSAFYYSRIAKHKITNNTQNDYGYIQFNS